MAKNFHSLENRKLTTFLSWLTRGVLDKGAEVRVVRHTQNLKSLEYKVLVLWTLEGQKSTDAWPAYPTFLVGFMERDERKQKQIEGQWCSYKKIQK